MSSIKLLVVSFVGLGVLVTSYANAQDILVVGGQTNVLLDTELLSSVGLDLSGVSEDVIAPGSLGGASVAFPINSRTASSLPTTFAYTVSVLAPFSGTIEHTGSVFFNDDMLEVGNLTIGFDAGRDDGAAGGTSGFFVASTVGAVAPIFDIEDPSSLLATADVLQVEANLLVSPELAGLLEDASLAGVDVGDAFVEARSVPEPSGLALFSIASLALFGLRRRAR